MIHGLLQRAKDLSVRRRVPCVQTRSKDLMGLY